MTNLITTIVNEDGKKSSVITKYLDVKNKGSIVRYQKPGQGIPGGVPNQPFDFEFDIFAINHPGYAPGQRFPSTYGLPTLFSVIANVSSNFVHPYMLEMYRDVYGEAYSQGNIEPEWNEWGGSTGLDIHGNSPLKDTPEEMDWFFVESVDVASQVYNKDNAYTVKTKGNFELKRSRRVYSSQTSYSFPYYHLRNMYTKKLDDIETLTGEDGKTYEYNKLIFDGGLVDEPWYVYLGFITGGSGLNEVFGPPGMTTSMPISKFLLDQYYPDYGDSTNPLNVFNDSPHLQDNLFPGRLSRPEINGKTMPDGIRGGGDDTAYDMTVLKYGGNVNYNILGKKIRVNRDIPQYSYRNRQLAQKRNINNKGRMSWNAFVHPTTTHMEFRHPTVPMAFREEEDYRNKHGRYEDMQRANSTINLILQLVLGFTISRRVGTWVRIMATFGDIYLDMMEEEARYNDAINNFVGNWVPHAKLDGSDYVVRYPSGGESAEAEKEVVVAKNMTGGRNYRNEKSYYNIPINKLIKGSDELKQFMEGLENDLDASRTSFTVNVTPYMTSEYGDVVERWSKILFGSGYNVNLYSKEIDYS